MWFAHCQSSGLTFLPTVKRCATRRLVHATSGLQAHRNAPPVLGVPGWVINILDPATRWKGSVVADDRRPTTATEVSKINFTASSVVPSSNVFLPPPYRVRVSVSGISSRIPVCCCMLHGPTVPVFLIPEPPWTHDRYFLYSTCTYPIVFFNLLCPRSGIEDSLG